MTEKQELIIAIACAVAACAAVPLVVYAFNVYLAWRGWEV